MYGKLYAYLSYKNVLFLTYTCYIFATCVIIGVKKNAEIFILQNMYTFALPSTYFLSAAFLGTALVN